MSEMRQEQPLGNLSGGYRTRLLGSFSA